MPKSKIFDISIHYYYNEIAILNVKKIISKQTCLKFLFSLDTLFSLLIDTICTVTVILLFRLP